MPIGILPSSNCSVKEISMKNSLTSKDLENLDINDVLEIIKLLLNYIRKKKNREPPLVFLSSFASVLAREREGWVKRICI